MSVQFLYFETASFFISFYLKEPPVYTAFSFGMTYFAPFRIDLRIKILPTLP